MKQEWKGAVRLGVVLFALYLAVHYWNALSGFLVLAVGAAFPLLVGMLAGTYSSVLLSGQFWAWLTDKAAKRKAAKG